MTPQGWRGSKFKRKNVKKNRALARPFVEESASSLGENASPLHALGPTIDDLAHCEPRADAKTKRSQQFDKTRSEQAPCERVVRDARPVLAAMMIATCGIAQCALRSSECSVSTCAELGWKSFSDLGTCVEPDASPLAGCSGPMDWEAAHDACESVGGRLCTAHELTAARGAGCPSPGTAF